MKTQRKFCLCAALLAAATLFLACTNDTQSASPQSNPLTITFNPTEVACKKGYFGYEGDVTSGTTVKERDWYKFTAKLNSGEAVKNWLINGKPESLSNKTEYTYQVKPADFAPDETITVSFEKL